MTHPIFAGISGRRWGAGSGAMLRSPGKAAGAVRDCRLSRVLAETIGIRDRSNDWLPKAIPRSAPKSK
jgi:hypothetical protein